MFTFTSQSDREMFPGNEWFPNPIHIKKTLKELVSHSYFVEALTPHPPNEVKRRIYYIDLDTKKIVHTIDYRDKDDLMKKIARYAESFTADKYPQF
jgi:hypothetical protein